MVPPHHPRALSCVQASLQNAHNTHSFSNTSRKLDVVVSGFRILSEGGVGRKEETRLGMGTGTGTGTGAVGSGWTGERAIDVGTSSGQSAADAGANTAATTANAAQPDLPTLALSDLYGSGDEVLQF